MSRHHGFNSALAFAEANPCESFNIDDSDDEGIHCLAMISLILRESADQIDAVIKHYEGRGDVRGAKEAEDSGNINEGGVGGRPLRSPCGDPEVHQMLPHGASSQGAQLS